MGLQSRVEARVARDGRELELDLGKDDDNDDAQDDHHDVGDGDDGGCCELL